MGRFLIYFSYFGTRYIGLQRQTRLVKGQPVSTVQSALESALKRLRPTNEIKIILSSRTDRGVHSLKNACHVDLEYPVDGKEYDPDLITSVVNYGLQKHFHDIRVLETRQVSSSFHARLFAAERKYVYRIAHRVGCFKTEEERLAIVREFRKYNMPMYKNPKPPELQPLPLTDVNKISVFRNKLDVSKLIAAAGMCSGIHDYSSFTKPIKPPNFQPHPVKMMNIGVKRGRPFSHPLDVLGHNSAADLEYWDIHIRARSFLYRQVRRMVGAMVQVAKDKIQLGDLQDILDNPRVNYPFAGLLGLEETGLFLVDVVYNPEDLVLDNSAPETEECTATSWTQGDSNVNPTPGHGDECVQDELTTFYDECKKEIPVIGHDQSQCEDIESAPASSL